MLNNKAAKAVRMLVTRYKNDRDAISMRNAHMWAGNLFLIDEPIKWQRLHHFEWVETHSIYNHLRFAQHTWDY